MGEEMSARKALATYGLLGLYFAWFLIPVIWLALSTIRPVEVLQAGRFILIPDNPTLDHYRTVLGNPNYQVLFVNSFIITLGTCVLTMVLSILGAYSLSRYEYPGRRALLLTFLATKMLPLVLILIPFFAMMYTFGLINTYIGIILAHTITALPLAMWLLKGYFDEIPDAFDEAARMDGCSYLGTLRHIILPLSIPGLSVAFFYTFITSWNEFLFVSILSQTGATRTLPFGLYLFTGTESVNWGPVLTAAFLTAVPSIILFALVQKYIVSGFSIGGTHGQ